MIIAVPADGGSVWSSLFVREPWMIWNLEETVLSWTAFERDARRIRIATIIAVPADDDEIPELVANLTSLPPPPHRSRERYNSAILG